MVWHAKWRVRGFMVLVAAAGVVLLASRPAAAMVRVMKYRPMTTVSADEVCVFARHEMNPLRKNQANATNTKDPVVCRLTVDAEAAPRPPLGRGDSKVLSHTAVQTFVFEELTKTCVSYRDLLPVGFHLQAFKGLSTECTTVTAAPRVFAGYKAPPGVAAQPATATKAASK